jgi:hypothetical protein
MMGLFSAALDEVLIYAYTQGLLIRR